VDGAALAELEVGTVAEHFGQRTDLPTAASGKRSVALQLGQEMLIGKAAFPEREMNRSATCRQGVG